MSSNQTQINTTKGSYANEKSKIIYNKQLELMTKLKPQSNIAIWRDSPRDKLKTNNSTDYLKSFILIDYPASLLDAFAKHGHEPILFGELVIIDMAIKERPVRSRCKIGVLITTGCLLLYESTKKMPKLYQLNYDVNLTGASVLHDNKTIIVTSQSTIHLQIIDETKTTEWYQNFLLFAKPEKKIPILNKPFVKSKSTNEKISSRFNWQLKSIRKQLTADEIVDEISNKTYYCENNFLAGHLKSPNISHQPSVANINIDEQFSLKSLLWARVTNCKEDLHETIYKKMLVTLTRNAIQLCSNKKEFNFEMKDFLLETVQSEKWSIRLTIQSVCIYIKLNSKENYEQWSLAFLKIFKCNETEGNARKNQIGPSGILNLQSTNSCKEQYCETPNYDNFVSHNFVNTTEPIYDNFYLLNNSQTNTQDDQDNIKCQENDNENHLCAHCNFANDCFDESNIYIPLPVKCNKNNKSNRFKKASKVMIQKITDLYEIKKSNNLEYHQSKSENNLFASFKLPPIVRNLNKTVFYDDVLKKNQKSLSQETVNKIHEKKKRQSSSLGDIPISLSINDDDNYEIPISIQNHTTMFMKNTK